MPTVARHDQHYTFTLIVTLEQQCYAYTACITQADAWVEIKHVPS